MITRRARRTLSIPGALGGHRRVELLDLPRWDTVGDQAGNEFVGHPCTGHDGVAAADCRIDGQHDTLRETVALGDTLVRPGFTALAQGTLLL